MAGRQGRHPSFSSFVSRAFPVCGGDSSKMVIKITRQNKRKIANIKEKKKEKKELNKKHKHYEIKLGLTKQNNVIFIFGNWGYHLCPSKTPSVFELCSCNTKTRWMTSASYYWIAINISRCIFLQSFEQRYT